jgi:hypothetical protein
MLAPCKQQRIDQPLARNGRPRDLLQLRIDETDVERRVVDHQRRVAEKGKEVIGDGGEHRLVGEELGGQAVHLLCLLRHLALRIDIAVEGLTGRHPIEDLDAADLDEPIAAQRIESGRFGVENNFAHGTRCRNLKPAATARITAA